MMRPRLVNISDNSDNNVHAAGITAMGKAAMPRWALACWKYRMLTLANRQLRRDCDLRLTWKLLAIVCVILGAGASTACGQSETPEFTGERLAFSDVDSAAWQSLAAVITDLEKTGKQTYYVVVVQSSGDSPTATRDYTDRLYEHWIQQATRSNLPFDSQRSVLVVLAIQNRQLSVHAGQALLQSYGMNAQMIDQQLVQPHFIPYAKAGNYPEGVRVLLTQINARILAHDASLVQHAPVSPQPSAIVPQRDIQVCSQFSRANFARVPMRIFGGAGNSQRTRVNDRNGRRLQSLGPNFEFNLLQLGGIGRRAPHSKKREAPHRPDQPHSAFLIACQPNNNQHHGGNKP